MIGDTEVVLGIATNVGQGDISRLVESTFHVHFSFNDLLSAHIKTSRADDVCFRR